MGLGKLKLCTELEVASFSRCRNIKGEAPNFGELPKPIATLTFFWWDFMMGLGKLQLHVKFVIADFIYYGNIREFVLNDKFAFRANFWGVMGNYELYL